jgi:hypothetical protein
MSQLQVEPRSVDLPPAGTGTTGPGTVSCCCHGMPAGSPPAAH